MRPLHLRIVATGLMSACAIVVIHRAAEPDRLMDTVGIAPHVVKAPRSHRAPVMEPGTSEPRAGRSPIRGGRVQSLAGMPSSEMQDSASVSSAASLADDADGGTPKQRAETAPVAGSADTFRPIGVQLGQDVRLPAALMNRSGNGLLIDERHVSPEVTAAREEIANSFYRELADHALSKPIKSEKATANPQDEPAETSDDGTTVVITPGPQAEDALTRADEIYRALYGDEAYNRHSIGSAIEVMLPASGGEGVK